MKSRASELRVSSSILRRIVRLTVETNTLTGTKTGVDKCQTNYEKCLAGVAVVSLIVFFVAPVREQRIDQIYLFLMLGFLSNIVLSLLPRE